MDNDSVAFPDEHRFDDRSLRADDDGHDFERFVLQCLEVELDQAHLLRRLARSNDGSIDLLREAAGAATVVECKFIGRSSTSRATRPWREVAEKLLTHLPALAEDPARSATG